MLTENRIQFFKKKYRDHTEEELREMDYRLIEERDLLKKGLEEGSLTINQEERLDEILDIQEYLNQPRGRPAGLSQPTTGERGFGFGAEAGEEEKNRAFGEMLQSVARAALPSGGQIAGLPCGRIDNRLLQAQEEFRSSGLESSVPSTGGFLVGKELSNEIISRAHKVSKIWDKVRKIPIGAGKNGLKIPFIDETSRATGSRLGGIQVYRLEEGGTKTASKPKFGLMEWALTKMIGLCYATDELLEDAAALGTIVMDGFAQEFGFKLDDECINGTGAGGQFLGILNAPCLVTISKAGGQSAKTISFENLVNMFAQFAAGSFDNGVFLINQNCLPQLMMMEFPVGTGGSGPVWMPANGISRRPFNTLLGLPVIICEQCLTLGTVGDIILADWTQYVAITKGGLQSATSIHVKFTTDETTFRFVLRNQAHPSWNSSLVPYKDSTSSKPTSPFVVLATRG